MWNGSSCLFVWFDSLCRSQQSFIYVGTGLPGLNQYWVRINDSCSRTQRSNAGEARIRNPSVLRQALCHWATALLWNGNGWYGFIGAILASVQWYTFMLSVIFIWEYNLIGSRSSVGGKPSCSSRVREFHCDPTKVHYFLEISHENRYTYAFIRHLPLIQQGFLSVSSESICKKYCSIPLFHTGPESHESPRIDKYLGSWAETYSVREDLNWNIQSVVSSCNS